METTLLLNASFEPLRIITWQRAVSLLFLGKVEVVDVYDHEVRSVSVAVKVPAVVRLLRYVRLGTRKPPLNKINLLARDHFTCQYCHKQLNAKDSTVDHVVPRSSEGKTTWENVVVACHECNRRKGGRTPKEARMTLRVLPKQPEWLPVLHVRFRKNIPSAWLVFLDDDKD